MEIVMIAAVAENGVIGANGAMPWRLKSDLKRLKALTIGQARRDGAQDLRLRSAGRCLGGPTSW